MTAAELANLRRCARLWNKRLADTWGSSHYARERRRFYRLSADHDAQRRRTAIFDYLTTRAQRAH